MGKGDGPRPLRPAGLRPTPKHAIRARAHVDQPTSGVCEVVLARASELGVLGWVRLDDADLLVHAEGDQQAVDGLEAFLQSGMPGFENDSVEVDQVKTEGHEQFAIRGVAAGVFVIQEHQATAHHFDLRLEVDGVMRSWAVPKEPSMDPSVKRLAIEVEDHSIEHNQFEGETANGWVKVWDRGTYEQGGRVGWPEALDRGHAVFVLHGERLGGGFALQRTRGGDKPQWLLIKRRDEQGRAVAKESVDRPRT